MADKADLKGLGLMKPVLASRALCVGLIDIESDIRSLCMSLGDLESHCYMLAWNKSEEIFLGDICHCLKYFGAEATVVKHNHQITIQGRLIVHSKVSLEDK